MTGSVAGRASTPLAQHSVESFVVRQGPHPRDAIDRFGFPLSHPYVDHCILARLGPSATALLRKLPELWRCADPLVVAFDDLALAIGLRMDHLSNTIRRLVKYGFAERSNRTELRVFTRCAPLTARELQQLPALVVDTHLRLVTAHVSRHLSNGDQPVDEAAVRRFVERLALLQHTAASRPPSIANHNHRKESQSTCQG